MKENVKRIYEQASKDKEFHNELDFVGENDYIPDPHWDDMYKGIYASIFMVGQWPRVGLSDQILKKSVKKLVYVKKLLYIRYRD